MICFGALSKQRIEGILILFPQLLTIEVKVFSSSLFEAFGKLVAPNSKSSVSLFPADIQEIVYFPGYWSLGRRGRS